MSKGNKKATAIQIVGKEFEKFLKSLPKIKGKSKGLIDAKKAGLKEICINHQVDFEKVCRIFITN